MPTAVTSCSLRILSCGKLTISFWPKSKLEAMTESDGLTGHRGPRGTRCSEAAAPEAPWLLLPEDEEVCGTMTGLQKTFLGQSQVCKSLLEKKS